MERAGQKNLVLILARELASNVATPVFVIDDTGKLVFFNEPGAEILGVSFAETGELSAHEWGTRWEPTTLEGEPFAAELLPLSRALQERRPAHSGMRITTPDGTTRQILVTAVPLFAKTDEFVGALAVFWED